MKRWRVDELHAGTPPGRVLLVSAWEVQRTTGDGAWWCYGSLVPVAVLWRHGARWEARDVAGQPLDGAALARAVGISLDAQ